MRQYIDVTGKTEEEAIQNALRQLGMDRDDVSVEILERAKSGFLGLGSCPAKVRVSYGPEEEEPAPAPVKEEKADRWAEERWGGEAAAEEAPRKPRREERKPRRERRTEDRPAPKQERQETAAPAEAVRKPAPVPQDLGDEVDDEKAQAIRKFLSGLLEQMESSAEIRVYLPEKGRYKVILEGKNLGALIGRRGETLDAIQQLTGYAVNRAGGGRVRVQLDAEGYREKREQSLQHLARKTAAKVTKYHRSFTLEPMNAYERHVIHTALQDVPGVTTYSVGTEPGRRVVVACDQEKR